MDIPDVFNEGEEGAVGEAERGATEANDNLQKQLDVDTKDYSEKQLTAYQNELEDLQKKVETAQNTLSRAKATQDLRKEWLDSKDNKDFQKKLEKVAGGLKELEGSFTLDSLKSPSEVSTSADCPAGLKDVPEEVKKVLADGIEKRMSGIDKTNELLKRAQNIAAKIDIKLDTKAQVSAFLENATTEVKSALDEMNKNIQEAKKAPNSEKANTNMWRSIYLLVAVGAFIGSLEFIWFILDKIAKELSGCFLYKGTDYKGLQVTRPNDSDKTTCMCNDNLSKTIDPTKGTIPTTTCDKSSDPSCDKDGSSYSACGYPECAEARLGCKGAPATPGSVYYDYKNVTVAGVVQQAAAAAAAAAAAGVKGFEGIIKKLLIYGGIAIGVLIVGYIVFIIGEKVLKKGVSDLEGGSGGGGGGGKS